MKSVTKYERWYGDELVETGLFENEITEGGTDGTVLWQPQQEDDEMSAGAKIEGVEEFIEKLKNCSEKVTRLERCLRVLDGEEEDVGKASVSAHLSLRVGMMTWGMVDYPVEFLRTWFTQELMSSRAKLSGMLALCEPVLTTRKESDVERD